MKVSPLLLSVSLIANAVLLGVLLLNSDPASRAGGKKPPPSLSATEASARGSSTSDAKNASIPGNKAALAGRAAHLNPEDLPGLLAWLRASGFPPRAVTAIITDLAAKSYSARQQALSQPDPDLPYWKNASNLSDNPEVAAERVKLQRSYYDQLKQLFGDKMMDQYYSDNEEQQTLLRRQIGNLPSDKLNDIATIEQDYALLLQELRSKSRGGPPSPADAEKLIVLEKEHRADIARLLTPEELLDFQMHYGPTSNRMRRDLALFKPSEEEYRALFPVLDSVEQRFPTTLGGVGETAAARRTAEEQLHDQIAATLGAERFQAFKQATDPANAQLNRLVSRLDLPLTSASSVAAIRNETQQRATLLRQNQELAPEARNAQLAALADEASSKISAVMGGTRGLDAYKENGGQWLTNLVPRPTGALAPK